jgi:NADH dehydrogenase
MILIVGASGALGSIVARRLLEKGEAVRGMSRTPQEKLAELEEMGAEVVQGDLRDAASLRRACDGVTKVVAAAHSIFGRGGERSELVDDKGHRDLIDAASEAGVQQLVYNSVIGASPDHLSMFARYKYEVEQYLKASGLPYTIIRASAFMWFQVHTLIGQPLLETGKVRLFGKGESLRNFVDEGDVAECVLMALENPDLRGETIEIGGPENLSTVDVVSLYERLSGRKAQVSHVPQGALRIMSPLLRPFHPGLSQVMALSLDEELHGSSFDAAPLLERYPLELTSVEEYARGRLEGASG